MERYEELILEIMRREKRIPENGEALIHDAAYRTLQKIKLILETDQLDDRECFERMERIVRLYEELGSECGNRHDFG